MKLFISALLSFSLVAQSSPDADSQLYIDAIQRISNHKEDIKNDFDVKGSLFKRTMDLNATTTSPECRLYAATWLVQRNMHVGMHFQGKTSYLKATRNQEDLLKAWILLDSPNFGDLRRKQEGLKLEIAWHLLDIEKMEAAYRFISKLNDLQDRELVYCFLAAVHLGQWEDLKGFEALAKSKGFEFSGFHQRALSNLSMFDYESILKSIELGKPAISITPRAVRSYRVKKWRVKFVSITGSDQSLLKPITSQLTDKAKGWRSHEESTVLLAQVGAVAHWLESYAQPPVSGFIEPDRIFLTGYRETNLSTEGPLRQFDVWDMRLDPSRPGYWVGTNIMRARKPGAAESTPPSIQLVMEHEWQLELNEDLSHNSK